MNDLSLWLSLPLLVLIVIILVTPYDTMDEYEDEE